MKLTRPIMCLATTAALLGGCGSDKTTPTASPTSSASPTASPKASAQTSVVYSMHDLQRPDSGNDLGTFRRRVPGGQATKVNLKAAGRRYVSTPSGRFLAYYDGAIWVAQASSVPSFRKIADPQDPVLSMAWASDGSRLFYNVGPLDEAVKNPMERFFFVRFDGSAYREFVSFPSKAATEYQVRELLGYDDETDEVIWNFGIADGAGGSYELYATNVTSRQSRSLGVSRDVVDVGASVLSADTKRYYYVRNHRLLVERTVAGGSERTLYTAADSERAIEGLQVSEDGSALLFQGAATRSFDSDSQTIGTRSTYRLDLATGNVELVLSETGGDEVLKIGSLSPDGRHLWLRTYGSGDEAALLDVASGAKTVIKPEPGADSIRFLAWLTV